MAGLSPHALAKKKRKMKDTNDSRNDAKCSICRDAAAAGGSDLGPAYRECRACGFVWRVDRENFPDPKIAYAREGEAVQDLLDQEADEGRTAYYQTQLARLRRAAPSPPGRLLEIGCGTGGLAKAASDAGWDVLALEPGPALCRAAQGLLGPRRVLGCSVETADIESESFDAAVALDLIEHLPDPHILARRAAEWLRPGGVFLLQTPNARSLRRRLHGPRWNMIQPDRHFLFHTPRSLRILLEGRGFDVLSLRTVSGGAGAASPLRRALTALYSRALSPLSLGNALLAVARKK